ncbi:hypothetical protein GALMADRAFT_253359 [Galerina marginata CBS 339.88]|uniref:Uncharacterized protein n=1 Tax=Galerina marginata (strain CBS 339.88) TaxID=685588 RepID=A0A067SMG7_GALM3|nr:hypothetical protein GALMADRAFT_253359 [Galerina marginata CBS 339.88]
MPVAYPRGRCVSPAPPSWFGGAFSYRPRRSSFSLPFPVPSFPRLRYPSASFAPAASFVLARTLALPG